MLRTICEGIKVCRDMLRTICDGIKVCWDMLRTICDSIKVFRDMLRTICNGIKVCRDMLRTICDGILNGLDIHRTICACILIGLDMLRMICKGIKKIDCIVLLIWSNTLYLHLFNSDIPIRISFLVIWIDFNGFVKISNCFAQLHYAQERNASIKVCLSIIWV